MGVVIYLIFMFLPVLCDLWFSRSYWGEAVSLVERSASPYVFFAFGWYVFVVLFLYLGAYFFYRMVLLSLFGRVAAIRSFEVLASLVFVIYIHAVSIFVFPGSFFSGAIGYVSRPDLIFIVGSVLGLFLVFYWLLLSVKNIVLLVFVVVAFFVPYLFVHDGGGQKAQERKNVILIGVDSLSAHALEDGQSLLPNMTKLWMEGVSFRRAYTNIGRTYPAWVTLLTGAGIQSHRAYFNLSDREWSANADSILVSLRREGYYSVLGIDERRFNNMGEEFGFDVVVGPKFGAPDFVVQALVDNPLANLLLQWRGSKWVLPWSWMNVAAHSGYRPEKFVDEVVAALPGGEKPVFLAVHFESAHFPFNVRDNSHVVRSMADKYTAALSSVDVQVGMLLTQLKNRGYLDNALVVFLSDHGEAMGEYEGSVSFGEDVFLVQSYGHGTDLLSDHQNRIPLSFATYIDGQMVVDQEARMDHVSLQDVRSMVERYLASGQVSVSEAAHPCFFVETGLRMESARNYENLNQITVAREAEELYRQRSGILVLKDSAVNRQLAKKDVGYRCAHKLVWYSYEKDRVYGVDLSDVGEVLGPSKVTPQEEGLVRSYRQNYLKIAESGMHDR